MTETTTGAPDPVPPVHPWQRMVAIGDSFTEGIGDPDPGSPGGHRGWADRVAEELDDVVGRIAAGGATVVMVGGPDIGATPVLRGIRGRIAIYNENVRVVASRHDAVLVDLWGLRELADPAMWDPDRLHFSPLGHHRVAVEVLDTLGLGHGLVPEVVPDRPPSTWQQARREDLVWAHRCLRPWVARRIRRTSSGAQVRPKRPHFGTATVPGGGIAPGNGTTDG